MHFIRPIELKDHSTFVEMAQSASIGITSLPKNSELLLKRIEDSNKAFLTPAESHHYLFVLENGKISKVEGVAGILSKTAVQAPEFFFRIEKQSIPQFHPEVCQEHLILHPSVLKNGPTEIGSLFLSRENRKAGLGRLLSFSRFLFMAAFCDRFDPTVTALMRGYFNSENQSPFWEGVGRKFFNLDFPTLLHLREKGEEFVTNFFPKYPIYASLLHHSAQAVIGQIHPHTAPALKMLQQEGFQLTGQIDFFDAGPEIASPLNSIRTVRESRVAVFESVEAISEKEKPYLISNERLNFRATWAPLVLKESSVRLSQETAQVLQIKEGDAIRYVAPH